MDHHLRPSPRTARCIGETHAVGRRHKSRYSQGHRFPHDRRQSVRGSARSGLVTTRRSDQELCGSDGAPQGYPPPAPQRAEERAPGARFRRRFAALTRAMRSPIDWQLSERRPRRVTARAGVKRGGYETGWSRFRSHGTLLVAAAELALDRVGQNADQGLRRAAPRRSPARSASI